MHSTIPIFYAAQNILNFLLSFEENNVHIITKIIVINTHNGEQCE